MTSEICNAVSDLLNLDWACQETDYSGRGEEVLSTLRGSGHELDGLMPLSVALPSLGPAEGWLPLLEGAAPALPWLAVAAASAYGTYAIGKELLSGASPFTVGPALGGVHEGAPIQAADPWILAHPADQPGWAHTLFPGDVVNQASATITPVFQGVGPVYDGLSLAGVSGATAYASKRLSSFPTIDFSQLGEPLATLPATRGSPVQIYQWGPEALLTVKSGPDARSALTSHATGSLCLRDNGYELPMHGQFFRIINGPGVDSQRPSGPMLAMEWKPTGLWQISPPGSLQYIRTVEDVDKASSVSGTTLTNLFDLVQVTRDAAVLPPQDAGFLITGDGKALLIPTGEPQIHEQQPAVNSLSEGPSPPSFVSNVDALWHRINAKLNPRR